MKLSLSRKIALLAKLGNYIRSENNEWETAKEKTTVYNSWFIPEFVDVATRAIGEQFLQENKLQQWVSDYQINDSCKKTGIVMAGNLPAVGFHDLLCGFLSGHRVLLKLSTKDNILIPHLIKKLTEWEPVVSEQIAVADRLNGCDAYIATGSNNSARYFQQYFGKYPHIIRRNRTAVAILDGSESQDELQLLADDMLMYFGRGCRNVTKVFVPENYDFVPLLETMKKYSFLKDFHHFKNNFDYQLSLLLLNQTYYMTNELVLLRQHASPFSPVGVVHYDYFTDKQALERSVIGSTDIQAVVGHGHLPFGAAQTPGLSDYADGVDTMKFLTDL